MQDDLQKCSKITLACPDGDSSGESIPREMVITFSVSCVTKASVTGNLNFETPFFRTAIILI